MVYTFSRAFWGTWALRLEGAIVSVLRKIGVVQLFEGSGKIHSDEKGRFDKGATEVGDCFILEANLSSPPTTTSNTLSCGSLSIDGVPFPSPRNP
ncbi:hypothetical protein AYX13_05538 [Cryptococcus neoformans]|nr:hypothetical protein AYX13_05538 [Cryptococcus neoformans var. grubii]